MHERTLTLTFAASELPYPVASELVDLLFEIASALQDHYRAEALAAHHDHHCQLPLALGWPEEEPANPCLIPAPASDAPPF